MEHNTAVGAASALLIAGVAVLAALVLRATESLPEASEEVQSVIEVAPSPAGEESASIPTGPTSSLVTPTLTPSSIAALPVTTSQSTSVTTTTSTTAPATTVQATTVQATTVQATSTSAEPQPTSTTVTASTTAEVRPGPVDSTSPNLQTIAVRFESRVDDVSASELGSVAMGVLADPRGWLRAGIAFVSQPDAPHLVVIAEPAEVDQLCLPLGTKSEYSCQQGPVVAINAERWRSAVPHWDGDLDSYRAYLINHELGHLFGQRHPSPRCPIAGGRASVMEQQTISLDGCIGNSWPLGWEIQWASRRSLTLAPPSSWNGPSPTNQGDQP